MSKHSTQVKQTNNGKYTNVMKETWRKSQHPTEIFGMASKYFANRILSICSLIHLLCCHLGNLPIWFS